MERGYIFVSEKHYQRWKIIELVDAGRLTLKEAATKMGISYRQAKRLRHAARTKGASALAHGNRGRLPHNKTSEELAERILALSRETYSLFNDSHFTQKLAEREGITVSRETVRRLRRKSGIASKRKRRPPRHHKRRERKAQEGLMMLWDGSPHRWFGPDGPELSLMAAIDDATSKLLAARLFPFEGSAGYLWLLDRVIGTYGVPLSIYHDRHGSLHRNDKHWSIEEQLAGSREPTQVGRALKALEIQPIAALSPQAKGRVERLFETLQDRLVAELDLEKIREIDGANHFIETHYIDTFNRDFAVPAREVEKAWRRLIPRSDLKRLLSFYYEATVGNDNAVRLGGLVIDIPPGPRRRSWAKCRVEVRQLLDGSWRVYYRDSIIAEHPSTTLSEPLRALRRRRARGADSCGWMYLGPNDKAADYALI
jgi:transposase